MRQVVIAGCVLLAACGQGGGGQPAGLGNGSGGVVHGLEAPVPGPGATGTPSPSPSPSPSATPTAEATSDGSLTSAFETGFRQSYRVKFIETCSTGAKQAATRSGNAAAADLDYTPLCGCAADRLLSTKSVAELMRGPSEADQLAVTQQCLREHPLG